MNFTVLYTHKGLSARMLDTDDKPLFNVLALAHDDAKNNRLSDDIDLNTYSKKERVYFLADAFGTTDNILQPENIKRTDARKLGLLRQCVACQLTFNDKAQCHETLNHIQSFCVSQNIMYCAYPLIDNNDLETYMVVIAVDGLLNANMTKFLLLYLNDKLSLNLPKAAYNLQPIPYPSYFTKTDLSQVIFNTENAKPFDTTELFLDYDDTKRATSNYKSLQKQTQSANALAYATDELDKAITAYLNDPKSCERLTSTTDDNYRHNFMMSFAEATLNGALNRDTVDQILLRLSSDDQDFLAELTDLYTQALKDLRETPALLVKCEHLSHFLPLAVNTQATNLSQLFGEMLPKDFKPDADMSLEDAANLVTQYFDFALLPGSQEDNVDRLAVYNPLTGTWDHDENEFRTLIDYIRPVTTPMQFKTIFIQLASQAYANDRWLNPYSGSRYIVFKNGVLDIVTEELLSFTNQVVRDCEFTARHRLSISWDPDAPDKEFPDDRPDHGTWSIDRFISGYAYNDPQLITFFLFGLSLGLFAGHNTSVHFDIQGPSRLGKSILSTIFDKLFENRIAITTYNKLNQPFPLDNFNNQIAIIWIKECNVDSEPLNSDYGTPFYDGLADMSARIPVKHHNDVIVDNPPQVFIDGTSFIQATEIHTGPAGRTLAFKLPEITGDDRDKIYSNNISNRLRDPEVLQHLVVKMVKAFKEIVPQNRWSNFKMNLASNRDLDLLPEKAREWRQLFVNANLNIKIWFDDEILPFLRTNGPMHDRILYELYLAHVRRNSKTGKDDRYAQGFDRFVKNLKLIFDEHEFKTDYMTGASIDKRFPNAKPRRRIRDYQGLGFDWASYNESYDVPISISNVGTSDLFNKKITGWYNIIFPKSNTVNSQQRMKS